MKTQRSGLTAGRLVAPWLLAAALACAGAPTSADPLAGAWPSAGHDLGNTRHQKDAGGISVQTVSTLAPRWVFQTAGDVSATPSVDGQHVYVPDWAGYVYAVERASGRQVWRVKVSDVTGQPLDKARATPVVAGDKIIVGTQGAIPAGGGVGGRLIALDKATGATRWVTTLDDHPAAIVTQSAVVHGNRVYVGLASLEEALAAFVPNYPCCSFRGSMLALDVNTGAIVWKTYMAPTGYSGNAIWGSAPSIDTRRGQLYVASGNNYSVPPAVLSCIEAAGNDQAAQRACLPADNLFDAIIALDLRSGAVRWAHIAIPFDIWTVACLFGGGPNCPSPDSPDYDFGQAPALFKAAKGGLEYVGAGQKSGQYWALNPDDGQVRWVTQAGPGGTAGGLQWGSAVDGVRVYTANANSDLKPWTLPDGSSTTQGVWSALDVATGQLLWQITPPAGGASSGPVTTTNGVVFGCSLDPQGHMVALDGSSGAVLWSYASGGSCLSGAAIAGGNVYWGSGYSNFGFGTPNNKLYAFELR